MNDRFESLRRHVVAVARLRVVQFLGLGALVFAVVPRGRDERCIDLSRADLAVALRAEDERHPARPARPSDVDERAIEDEVLYREGLRLGFDREDGVVRQRVIQKTLYFAEELAGATQPPSEAELQGYYERTRARWTQPATLTFQQIFCKDRSKLEAIVADLRRGALPPSGQGDPSPLPFEVRLDRDRLADALGESFAAALPTSPTAQFGPPLPSTFGWHAVRVLRVDPEHVAPFESVRRRVEEECIVSRREDAVASYLRKAFGDYRVRIGGVPVTRLVPSRRLAARAESSAED